MSSSFLIIFLLDNLLPIGGTASYMITVFAIGGMSLPNCLGTSISSKHGVYGRESPGELHGIFHLLSGG